MTTIKPIETVYNGYRFRSRLEARWAVFFDALGITYKYEKEGYDLGEAGWYLPDFWLPDLGTFVEVKGQKPSSEDLMKLRGLALSGAKLILVGDIPQVGKLMVRHYETDSYLPLEILEAVTGYSCDYNDACFYSYPDTQDNNPWQTRLYEGFVCQGDEETELLESPIVFVQNKKCGVVGYYVSNTAWVYQNYKIDNDWRDYDLSPTIDRAFNRARQARFEHGEKGAT